MTRHIERMNEGAGTAAVLVFVGGIIGCLYLFMREFVIPWYNNHTSKIHLAIAVILALIVLVYIIGYMQTDLADDIQEWREE
jgi:Na+-driven multidrug efflux pump